MNISGSAKNWVTDEMKNRAPKEEVEKIEQRIRIKPEMSEVINKLVKSHEEILEMYSAFADKNISDGLVSLKSAIHAFKNLN